MSGKVGLPNNGKGTLVGGWVGVGGSKAKLINGWVGDANNHPKLIYTAETPHGEQVFTSSGTFTVPSGVSKIDIFCVGGAGGYVKPSDYFYGGNGWSKERYVGYDDYEGVYRTTRDWCAQGGSGYTTTQLQVTVTSGETLTVSVGAAGADGSGRITEEFYTGESYSEGSYAAKSGGTSAVYRGSTALCSANGGGAPSTPNPATSSSPTSSDTSWTVGGGNGGSGGKCAGFAYIYATNNSGIQSGSFSRDTDSYNGSNGGNATADSPTYYNLYSGASSSWSIPSGKLGTGQGSTTKAFGESSGTLYDNFGEAGTVIIRW